MKKNWLHLDFKGIVPDVEFFCRWLDFFKSCGFTGIFFEGDCRIQWNCWKNAGRPKFSRLEFRRIIDYACSIGLETAPLIQSIGHLEWILTCPEYSYLGENGRINELCPHNPDSLKKITEWMEEVFELFPDSKYIHLGGDETWSLGTCPVCKKAAENSAIGALEAFARHIGKACEFAVEHGRRPVMWGDMFRRPGGNQALKMLPSEVIPVVWSYYCDQAPVLAQSENEYWGASAVQCSWNNYPFEVINNPMNRIENILGWHHTDYTLLHTTWGRPDNLRCLYPPWAGSVGVFIAAGSPEKWERHPWNKYFHNIADVFRRGFPDAEMVEAARRLPVQNEIEAQGRDYMVMALRHWCMWRRVQRYYIGFLSQKAAENYVGPMDRNAGYAHLREHIKSLRDELSEWEQSAADFWKCYHLSDLEEFIAEKREPLLLDKYFREIF